MDLESPRRPFTATFSRVYCCHLYQSPIEPEYSILGKEVCVGDHKVQC